MRYAQRIAILSCATAVVIAAVYFTMRPVPVRASLTYRRRPLAPRPGAIREFAEEFVVIGLVTLTGRKILRLRL
jgi:hypothetical protein